jgi:2,4-dienoyl-CoA reductase-like NADH-dependent reductase (Old Yellow Enzyme family)
MSTNFNQHPAFTSFGLKDRILNNRFVVAPMSRVSANADGIPGPVMNDYYTSFAEGGFGMIISEGTYTDSLYSQGYPMQPGIVNAKQTAGWAGIIDKVKEYATVFICQLMHAGALSQSLQHTKAPFSIQPAGNKMPEYGGGSGPFALPGEMTKADIVQVIEGFSRSAHNAWKAGFDGVEIHAANGYLLDQFLTSYTNQRTDEYGGSVENRFRLVSEIIKAIRESVPAGFIVGLRLSEGKVNDLFYRWPEGADMAKAMAIQVQRAQPDYVHIAAESGNWQRDCTYQDGTSFTRLVKSITGLPVIANGGLHDAQLSKHVLENNQADLLAIGKAALADPSWPLKIKDGIEPVPFHKNFIKPFATIAHANKMRSLILASWLAPGHYTT